MLARECTIWHLRCYQNNSSSHSNHILSCVIINADLSLLCCCLPPCRSCPCCCTAATPALFLPLPCRFLLSAFAASSKNEIQETQESGFLAIPRKLLGDLLPSRSLMQAETSGNYGGKDYGKKYGGKKDGDDDEEVSHLLDMLP